jgi:Zn-dependent protease with chaperone function
MSGTQYGEQRVPLTAIDAIAFQHPQDREATDGLKRLIGFDRVVAKFLELRYERLLYLYNTGSSVRVGARQFPRLYAMLRDGCAMLDMREPELYVAQSPLVNAFSFGHTSPYIMVYTGLLDLLDDDEVHTVIAHELGHIKCGHVLYNTMASSIQAVIEIIGQLTLGIGRIVGASIEVALMDWRRRSELSADRASLLVTQDTGPVIRTLTRLAGGTRRFADAVDPEVFLEQARQHAKVGDGNVLDTVYRALAEVSLGSHPFIVERVREIDAWAASTEYTAILGGAYPRENRPVQIRVKTRK